MEKESVKCPKCGKNVLMDESREIVFCTYCGEKIVVHNKTEKTSALEKNEVKLEKSKRVVPLQSKKTIRGNNKAGVIITIIATAILSIIVVVAVITSINNDGDISDGYTDEYQDEESSPSLEEDHLSEVPEGYIGIYTAEDFDYFVSSPEQNYILMNDIDLSKYGAHYDYQMTGGGLYVKGDFDGNNYSLKNYSADEALFTGIEDFGYIHDLYIDNFKISNGESILVKGFFYNSESRDSDVMTENVHITNSVILFKETEETIAGSAFGAITAHSSSIISGKSGKIINCSFDGKIRVYLNAESHKGKELRIGGISASGDCQYCNCSGEISVQNDVFENAYIGGIIGTGFAFRCRNAANVKTVNDCWSYVGGIVGKSEYNIEQCCNNGAIIANDDGSYAGGISGSAYQIKDCYNQGDIYGRVIGGISGEYIPELSNSYNIGNIKKYSDVKEERAMETKYGALYGWNEYNNKTMIENCYYTNDIAPTGNSKLRFPLTKKITLDEAQNEETFSGFDFDEIWTMGDEAYPYPILQGINYDDEN